MFARPSVVIDNGSYYCKAGFSCDNHPVTIFRNVVGRPRDRIGFYGKEPYDVYIGDDATSMTTKDYDLDSPIEHGKIVHWDNMERVWHHVFYKELKVAPEAQNAILAVSTQTSLRDKVKCCEILFENLNVPAICIQSQSVAAVYGSGFTTGVVVDLGYSTADVQVVYEGGNMYFAHMNTHLSSRNISEYIQKVLESKDVVLGDHTPCVVSDIQKNFLQIELQNEECALRHSYTLPDGTEINIAQILHCVPELIFKPREVLGGDTNVIPLHEAVMQCIFKCDSEYHDDLYRAVIPTGGMCAIPGLPKRLKHELQLALHRDVNVCESTEVYCLNWLGAAVFAGLKDSEKIWVKKKQFEEYGEKIVKTRFT